MRLSKLYVEGKLDTEIYTSLFSGLPTIEKGGSKNSLKPQARNDRSSGIQAGYLRDRDFDHDPPDDMDIPTVDGSDNGRAWGWRLNRHEIENYLLDDQVVAARFGIRSAVWQNLLCRKGEQIRWYQVARWTIGYARSQLPPNYNLQTRPRDVDEMRLPDDLTEQASLRWCRETISEFHQRIDQCLAEDVVNEQIERRREQFLPDLLNDHQHVLKWCSGKDLFASLDQADLQGTGADSPKSLCNLLRDWVLGNPDTFIGFFPEFAALKQNFSEGWADD